MGTCRPGVGCAVLVAWLATCPPAQGQASIEYSLIDHHVPLAGFPLTPIKSGAFVLAPVLQTDTLSLVLPGGHSITSVKYDMAAGKTGWKTDALAAAGGGIFESQASLNYHDAVILGVAASSPVPAGLVTVSITIDGSFSGATSQGSTGFELNAFGKFSGAYLQRKADPLHPGMDTVTLQHDAALSSFSVAAGITFPFSQTLSLSAPASSLGTFAPAPLGSLTLGNGNPATGCTVEHPCGVMARGIAGVATTKPLPIEFAVVDTLTIAGTGTGAAGESVIDQMNTATLSVQTPAGVYFLLSSGALTDDPASLVRLAATPPVPEPATPALLAAGLGWLLWRSRRTRQLRQGVPS